MQDRAKIWLESKKFLKDFHNKAIVVKVGGRVISNEQMLNNFLEDVVLLNLFGMRIVVVHGGGPEISDEMRKMGVKPKFIEGLRITDEKTMEILHEQLAGKISSQIVQGISRQGGIAHSMSGMDSNFITAHKMPFKTTTSKGKEIEIDLGLVGEVEKVDPSVINTLPRSSIPVIAPIGIDSEGRGLNINADMVAAEIAGAMRAKKLVIVTDVMGVMRDPNDEKTLISTMTTADVQALTQEGVIKRGMIPKMDACLRAMNLGVERCHIINGNIPHVLLLEILTEAGIGTMISRGK